MKKISIPKFSDYLLLSLLWCLHVLTYIHRKLMEEHLNSRSPIKKCFTSRKWWEKGVVLHMRIGPVFHIWWKSVYAFDTSYPILLCFLCLYPILMFELNETAIFFFFIIRCNLYLSYYARPANNSLCSNSFKLVFDNYFKSSLTSCNFLRKLEWISKQRTRTLR